MCVIVPDQTRVFKTAPIHTAAHHSHSFQFPSARDTRIFSAQMIPPPSTLTMDNHHIFRWAGKTEKEARALTQQAEEYVFNNHCSSLPGTQHFAACICVALYPISWTTTLTFGQNVEGPGVSTAV